MPMIGTDPEHNKVPNKLGQIAMQWNHIESLMRFALSSFVGGDKAEIITAHLNSTTFINIFTTLSNEFAPENLRPIIGHYVKFFERMREYRNYYIHGISYVDEQDGEAVGFLQTHTARGRLVLHQQAITLAELDACIADLDMMRTFFNRILDELVWGGSKKSLPGYRALVPEDMPTLPNKLNKPRWLQMERKSAP
jgi:hypothetical protein